MSERTHIVTVAGFSPARDAQRVGGKGAKLLAMTQAGFRVPAFFCVGTEVFAAVQARLAPLLEQELGPLFADGAHADDWRTRVAAASERIRAAIRELGVAGESADEIVQAFDAIAPSAGFVAVRSSVVGEDSAADSFAGQMDTYLYVSRGNLLARIADCLASAYSERALTYRALRQRGDELVRAGVVVQTMVDSDVAGIAFTVNPATGDTAETVVSACYGLGEGVVSGSAEADTYFLAGSSRITRRDIADKTVCVLFDAAAGAGTRLSPVSAERSSRAVLTDARVRAVAELARAVEAREGCPQDIEWAYVGDDLHLLQARPVTTLAARRETILDNVNVVENYPGLTLPLTFSFVRESYEETFREGIRMLGGTDAVVAEEAALFQNLVALADGRLYYNILNWYRLFQLLHFERALPAWEAALGIDGASYRPDPLTLWQRVRRAPDTARIRLAIAGRVVTLQRQVASYLKAVEESRAELRGIDLAGLDPHTGLDLVDRWSRKLRGPYGVTVVNDFYTQQLYDLLRRAIERWSLGDDAAFHNELLCGMTGMHSVEPVRSALSLAAEIRADSTLMAVFEDEDDRRVWEALRTRPALSAFRARVDAHLLEYGDRVLEELKLETPPLDDRPEELVRLLRNYARGQQTVGGMEDRERSIRERAEQQARRRIGANPLRRAAFELLLRAVRTTVVNRENLRLARARTFGLVKRVYGSIGDTLARDGVLAEGRDVFYLTLDELKGAVRGHLVMRDLKALVALRKADYASFAERELAHRISVRGAVYAADFPLQRVVAVGGEGMTLRGHPCSAGRAVAPARIVIEPRTDLEIRGEILVAPMTDPGWVFLMVAAQGLVVEKGSLLSHTAIIGRELGVPTVVGVADATRLIAEGSIIEIDGRAGTVEIRQSNDPAS